MTGTDRPDEAADDGARHDDAAEERVPREDVSPEHVSPEDTAHGSTPQEDAGPAGPTPRRDPEQLQEPAPDGMPSEAAAGPGAGDGAGRRRSLPRVPWSPWWRLGAAVAAVGALTWGVTASDAALRLGGSEGGGTGSDGPQVTAGPDTGTYVQTAVLACPGTAPWLSDDAGARPGVEVLAVGAPLSVLEGARPPADDGAATSPPDAAGQSAEPDDATSTAAPDDASSTAVPDDASATAGPDGEQVTGGPAPAPADGVSVLRTTDPDGPSAELEPGVAVGLSLERASSALVEASGRMAPGVVGGQLGLGTQAGSRGLTLSGCVRPGESQWLVGGGSAPGRAEQLVLTNPGPDPVTVTVAVWAAEGPVATTGAGGIVVPGGGRVVELLDGLAPAADAPVVAVSSTGGPVVAHLAESYRVGTTDRGAEVVPPVAAPATDLVVPALPAAPEGHERRVVLRVGAPGESQAVVEVTALTPEGAVRLADRVTRVPAGHTVDLELDELPEGATALRLRSDEPVTGGARLEVLPAEDEPEVVETQTATEEPSSGDDASATTDPGTPRTEQGEPLLRAAGDVAWVGATVPVAGPAGMALPDRSVVPGAGAALALTAVDATTAWVTWVDEDGAETAGPVELPNDTTELVAVPAQARAVWVVATGPAGVAAAVHVTGGDDRGPYVTASTVPELPWLRQVTQIRPVVP